MTLWQEIQQSVKWSPIAVSQVEPHSSQSSGAPQHSVKWSPTAVSQVEPHYGKQTEGRNI
jgi:hypothetical protein